MSHLFAYIFSNFLLFALAFACIWAVIKRRGLLDYLMLWPVGLGGLWAFFIYTFHPEFGSKLTGWEVCDFQSTAAAAFLGLGITGIVGFKQGRSFRLAVILFASAFFWGDLLAHFYQAYYIGVSDSSNVALIMYADFLIPSALWVAFTLDV